jgi:adenylate cyclase class 2
MFAASFRGVLLSEGSAVPVEIEAKMAVPDLDAVRAKLRELCAEPAGRTLETNTFFDTEDRSLLAADEGLRLRRNLSQDDGTDEHVITYKGPRQHGKLKSRDEVELVVASSEDATQLLERLGFVRMLTFEKRRESWKLGGCKVELDELPYLGSFVEVEGPGEEPVLAVREQLGLADKAMVKTSYIGLLMGHLQEHGGQGRRVVTFADAKNKQI